VKVDRDKEQKRGEGDGRRGDDYKPIPRVREGMPAKAEVVV
jgi:hypothetical protein